jgi:hypothetical protein
MRGFGRLFLIVLIKIEHVVEELVTMKIFFGEALDLFKVMPTH